MKAVLIINLTRRYGRAKGGARVCDAVPLATAKNTTVLSSIRTSGECVYTTYSGGTTTEKFIEYLENHLLPTLDKEKDVLIMDNMRTHHANAVQAVLAASGVKVLFLPPYSPDLNPIERLWSKMKGSCVMRKFGLLMNCLTLLLGLFLIYLSMIVLLGFVWFIWRTNSWICYNTFAIIYDSPLLLHQFTNS